MFDLKLNTISSTQSKQRDAALLRPIVSLSSFSVSLLTVEKRQTLAFLASAHQRVRPLQEGRSITIDPLTTSAEVVY